LRSKGISVGVDLLSTIPGKSGAVGIWVSMLRTYPGLAPAMEFYVFVTPSLKTFYLERIHSPGRNLHFVDVSFGSSRLQRLAFQEIGIPGLCGRFGIDVHYTCNPVPLFRKLEAREVWKITGLQQFYFPRQVGLFRSLYHRLTFGKKAGRSVRIIANSHFTKGEIIRLSGISGKKIRVIYESVDHEVFNMERPESDYHALLGREVGFNENYLLWISDIRPYKNPIPFLRAFREVLRMHDAPHNVIMIGNSIMGYRKKVREAARELGIAERVFFLDSLPRDKLVGFYRCADLFVYPSSLETFGIPPLEAMACGTPVIASNLCAVPEIVGDGALVIDPLNTGQFADAIWSVLSDPSLAADLVERGLKRAQAFSWESNAMETIELFEEAADGAC
jgi:hypothetical protein